MPLPLSGLLVVSLEQAVAAPMCTCRLADAGARVIKVERPEGDFARYYDKLAVPRTPTSPRLRGEHRRPSAAVLSAKNADAVASAMTRSVAGEGARSPSTELNPSPLPLPMGEGVDRVRGTARLS